MKPSRILPLLWVIATLGLFFAASQDWYQVLKPVPGLQKVVSSGLESFPLLATLPWLSILCLALAWYLGTLGKVLIGLLTAVLTLSGAAQILIQQTNFEVLLAKIEKHTGIAQTIDFIAMKTTVLGAKYLALIALFVLAALGIALAVNARKFPRRYKGPEQSLKPKSDDPQALWDKQSE